MLHVFDRDDKRLAILSNEGRGACPFWDATYREELNKGGSFEFTAPADHEASQYITAENKVAFRDKDGDFRLFVIKELEEVDDEGGPLIEVYCDPEWIDELNDNIIEDKRPQNVTARQALEVALEGSRYEVGNVASLGINSTNFYFNTSIESINKIQNKWGGEPKDRIVLDDTGIIGRYIDLPLRRGTDTGKRWEIDKDIIRIARIVKSYPKTALYGRGASLETEGGGHSRLLTFEDVEWKVANGDPVDKPLGQKWVGDPDALYQYGRRKEDVPDVVGTIPQVFAEQEKLNPETIYKHRFGLCENGNIDDQEELLRATWNALQEQNKPYESFELDVLLYAEKAGLDHEKVRLGDTTIAIDRQFSRPIEVQERVVMFEYDVSSPDDTGRVGFGQFFDILKDDERMDEMQSQINTAQGRANNPEVDDNAFPDIKPPTPTNFTANGLFKVIQLKWDFNASSYIASYELYASQTPNFNPTSDRLVWRGKTGGYAFEADTDEQWYFRLRAVNTHGTASDFTNEISAQTIKINAGIDVAPYTITDKLIAQNANIDGAKIGDATITSAKIANLIGDLITAGIIKDANDRVLFNLDDGILNINDGAIKITRPDGAVWLEDGYVHQDFNVSGYDPYATDEVDTPGGRIPAYRIEFDAGRYYAGLTDQIDGTLGFPDVRDPDRGYTLRFQRYEFIHSARYFVMRFQPSNRTDGLDKLRVRLYMGSESVYSRDFSDNEFGSFYSLIVDLGTPTYDRKNIDLYIGFLKQWKKNSIGIAFRFSRIYLTDIL